MPILTVYVKPRARQNALYRVDENTIRAEIHEPAQNGRANKALIAYLSKTFSLPQKDMSLVRGKTAAIKHILVPEALLASLHILPSKK